MYTYIIYIYRESYNQHKSYVSYKHQMSYVYSNELCVIVRILTKSPKLHKGA